MQAAKEEASYLANAEAKGTFSSEKYAAKRDSFEVIVLESDQDMEPRTAYLCYDDRWLLELVFAVYLPPGFVELLANKQIIGGAARLD